MSRSDDLAAIVTLAERRGVARLEVELDSLALTFGGPYPRRAAIVVTKATAFGHFASRVPGADHPIAIPGDEVAEGDLLGLLRIGSLYRPIRAPVAGTVRGILVADGALVGHGESVAEIELHTDRENDGEAAC